MLRTDPNLSFTVPAHCDILNKSRTKLVDFEMYLDRTYLVTWELPRRTWRSRAKTVDQSSTPWRWTTLWHACNRLGDPPFPWRCTQITKINSKIETHCFSIRRLPEDHHNWKTPEQPSAFAKNVPCITTLTITFRRNDSWKLQGMIRKQNILKDSEKRRKEFIFLGLKKCFRKKIVELEMHFQKNVSQPDRHFQKTSFPRKNIHQKSTSIKGCSSACFQLILSIGSGRKHAKMKSSACCSTTSNGAGVSH